MFPDIDDFQEMLQEIADKVPQAFFEKLSGGIALLEEEKFHPESKGGDLLILGEYIKSPFTRRIVIYYGSFKRTYSGFSRDFIYDKLEEVIIHEFRHHFESMANENDLELEDKDFIENYLKNKRP